MNKKTAVVNQLFLLAFFIILIAAGCKKDGNPNNSSTPLPTGFVDIDGNVYQTVKIGSQLWMAENLKVTRYRNGDKIPNVTDDTQWSNLTSGAYCNILNDTNYTEFNGHLYNFYVINDPRNICPPGWHIPSYSDWETLINCLGGDSIAGGKLKFTGYAYWNYPNVGATNESGFTAIGGGKRVDLGFDCFFRTIGTYWSSEEDNITKDILSYEMDYMSTKINKYYCHKTFGFSIRCVKD